MPRQRKRRRRRLDQLSDARAPAPPALDPPQPRQRRLPSATVIFALAIGIWLGLLIGDLPGTVPTIFLWISVIAASLSAGRLLRNWLLTRQSRRN